MTGAHKRVSAYLSACLLEKMDDPSPSVPVEIVTILLRQEEPIIPHLHTGCPPRLRVLLGLASGVLKCV